MHLCIAVVVVGIEVDKIVDLHIPEEGVDDNPNEEEGAGHSHGEEACLALVAFVVAVVVDKELGFVLQDLREEEVGIARDTSCEVVVCLLRIDWDEEGDKEVEEDLVVAVVQIEEEEQMNLVVLVAVVEEEEDQKKEKEEEEASSLLADLVAVADAGATEEVKDTKR